jgi:hypothetical protein
MKKLLETIKKALSNSGNTSQTATFFQKVNATTINSK